MTIAVKCRTYLQVLHFTGRVSGLRLLLFFEKFGVRPGRFGCLAGKTAITVQALLYIALLHLVFFTDVVRAFNPHFHDIGRRYLDKFVDDIAIFAKAGHNKPGNALFFLILFHKIFLLKSDHSDLGGFLRVNPVCDSINVQIVCSSKQAVCDSGALASAQIMCLNVVSQRGSVIIVVTVGIAVEGGRIAEIKIGYI